MAKSIVAALRVRPETILEDIPRLMELARVRDAMDPSKTTILKDNISWHFPFPGANTTPWQMEGVIRALRAARLPRPHLRAEQDRGHQRLQGGGPEPVPPHLQGL